MFTSTASKLSMLKNTEAFLSRFKWILNEEDYDDSEAAVIELEPSQNNQSLIIEEINGNINSDGQGSSSHEKPEESPFVSSSESLTSIREMHCECEFNESSIIKDQESLENLDLASFEVVHKGSDTDDVHKVKEDSKETQVQNNGFGDAGDTTLNVYKLDNKNPSPVKSFFSSFLEENGDGCIVPFTPPTFHKEAIIIGGDILSTAVQGIKAGVSFLFGDVQNNYREDIVHYRGYKLRTKGMELFLDSMHTKNNFQIDEESSVKDRRVHFQFKLSNRNRFWQDKELKKIVSLPLKVCWFDQINSTSMFVEVFDSEIEIEMPINIPKDSIVVACDPDQGTLSILAPPYPQ